MFSCAMARFPPDTLLWARSAYRIFAIFSTPGTHRIQGRPTWLQDEDEFDALSRRVLAAAPRDSQAWSMRSTAMSDPQATTSGYYLTLSAFCSQVDLVDAHLSSSPCIHRDVRVNPSPRKAAAPPRHVARNCPSHQVTTVSPIRVHDIGSKPIRGGRAGGRLVLPHRGPPLRRPGLPRLHAPGRRQPRHGGAGHTPAGVPGGLGRGLRRGGQALSPSPGPGRVNARSMRG